MDGCPYGPTKAAGVDLCLWSDRSDHERGQLFDGIEHRCSLSGWEVVEFDLGVWMEGDLPHRLIITATLYGRARRTRTGAP